MPLPLAPTRSLYLVEVEDAHPPPPSARATGAVERALAARNGYTDPQAGCPFTGLPRDSGDVVYNPPQGEPQLAGLSAWARAHGLVPPKGAARDRWKSLPQNCFLCSKSLRSLLVDGVERKVLLWPTREDLLAAIRLVEAGLAAAEDELLARHHRRSEDTSTWSLPVENILQKGWTRTLDLGGDSSSAGAAAPSGAGGLKLKLKLKLFEYQLLLFVEVAEAPLRGAQLAYFDPRKDEAVVPRATRGSDVLPTRFDSGLPRAQLPLSLPLVVLTSLAHVRFIRARLPGRRFSRAFLQECTWADYLLSCIESKRPSSWRRLWPGDLGFEAPQPQPQRQSERSTKAGPCWTAQRIY